jgi:hypothetical protein
VEDGRPQLAGEAERAYADRPVPLRDYAGLVAAFNAALAGALLLAERSGRPLPQRMGAADIALIGVATHKLSRIVTKERVTAFMRAPFTRLERSAGHGELEEHARGHGLRRAVGELLVCPYCLSQWVAGAFTAGLVLAPRPTRLIAGMFSAVAVSDFLQLAYKAAETRA